MKVLAIEPFYGGSHQAMLDGWAERSSHEFTIRGLPARRWKWRMRHAAVTIADQLRTPEYQRQRWSLLWVSDMFDLATFRGLVDSHVADLPSVVYFHENQLTYPSASDGERDLHFAFTNFTSALAADAVWFNSQFHHDEFLTAMQAYLARMPDFAPSKQLSGIREKSRVQSPGITALPKRQGPRRPGPMRICWNARWEHDKNPSDFFAALTQLKRAGVPFRLIVLGESFRKIPAEFSAAERDFAAEIDHFGYAASRSDYDRQLASADVVVSTARHEFFGIAVLEAISAGAWPVLPNRLAYPEIIRSLQLPAQWCLYDGQIRGLVGLLKRHARRLAGPADDELQSPAGLQAATVAYAWPKRAKEMDQALDQIVLNSG